jgi:transcriptional regulator with GAF, ATPase, and Fis domain
MHCPGVRMAISMSVAPPADTSFQRLDALTSAFVSTVVGLDAGEIARTIEHALGQIGEALCADRMTFEHFAEESTSYGFVAAWHRTSPLTAREPALHVEVGGGQPLGRLSIWSRDMSRPSSIVDRLQTLANLMVLAAQRNRHLQELAEARSDRGRDLAVHKLLVMPPSDDGTDSNDFDEIIGDSPALRVALSRVQEVAPTDATVVLLGETGTGKELFAKAVHNRSPRRNYPFVAVNCAALPPTLIESELFGHERGAFTGAASLRRGRFELAHRGTLFLDEVGDLPADVQAKLLRVLQEGEFERVGSSQSHRVDVRLIAATHHNLEDAVKEGRFRADLYYRLNVFPIALPALRERVEDIPRLVWFFVNRRQRALNRRFTSIPAAVLETLQRHSWPGNVRELENVVERAMIRSSGDALLLDEGPGLQISSPSEAGTLEAVERRHIQSALQRCRWRINGPGNAAESLGLHPNTLRFRMKKLGIERPATSVRAGTAARPTQHSRHVGPPDKRVHPPL